jgi:hypothetical protein
MTTPPDKDAGWLRAREQHNGLFAVRALLKSGSCKLW